MGRILDAVALSQKLMREVASRPLEIDGKWGKYTDGVWASLSEAQQASISSVLRKEFDVSVDQLRTHWRSSRFISKEKAKMYVLGAAQTLGLAQYSTALLAFLEREARKLKDADGELGYDVGSVNGSSRGLMQMQPAAWVDAYRRAPSIGSYSTNVYDAEKNILAGVAYASHNIALLKRHGVVVNGDTLYLAHNQGVGFFVSKKQKITAYEKQSAEVRSLIDKYRRN